MLILMAANSPASGGGYDYSFLSEPDDALKCHICLSVARDPRQHEECGKLFCSECIEKYGIDEPCPNCKKTGAQFYKDHRGRQVKGLKLVCHCYALTGKRDIDQLKVKCDNVERGCTWVGTVGTLEEHVAMCQFTLLPCPKMCKDDSNKVKQFMRKDLNEHLEGDCPNRDYSCEHCGAKGIYVNITNIHDKYLCLKRPVPCPNGCSISVQRQHVSKHVDTECELTVIACKYDTLGCDRELKRKDMAAHEEDDKLHLCMAMDTTVQLQNKTVKLEHKTVELERKTVELENALRAQMPLEFKVSQYRKKKERSEIVRSPSHFILPFCCSSMFMRVDVNGHCSGRGTHVSVFVTLCEGEVPFIGEITFTLLNQLEDKNHHQKTLSATVKKSMQVGSTWGYSQFIPHSALDYDAVNNTQYLKDDTLYFRMSVESADHKPWLQ